MSLTFDISPGTAALTFDISPPRGTDGTDGTDGAPALITPLVDAGAAETVVTYAERIAADLDYWVDGNIGIIYAEGTGLFAASANGPNNAIWTIDPNGDFLDSVLAANLATAGVIDPDTNYAAVNGILVLPSGDTISVYHGEEAITNPDPPDNFFWSFLGLAKWDQYPTDLGRIIEPDSPVDDPDRLYNLDVSGGAFAVSGGYFHVFYRECLDDGTFLRLSVARCSMDDLEDAVAADTVPTFTKWNGTAWAEPGIGGEGAEILPYVAGNPRWFDVVYLERAECWMMVYSETIDTAGTFTYTVGCTFSTNLVDWSPTQRLWTPESSEVLYLTLTAPLVASAEFDQKSAPGDEVWLYVTRSAAGNGGDRWTDATIDRHVIQVRSTRDAIQNRRPVNAQTGTAYTTTLDDQGKIITRSNAGASTHDWPSDANAAYEVGSEVAVINLGAGSVTHQAGSGASLVTGSATSQAQGARRTATKVAANTWSIA